MGSAAHNINSDDAAVEVDRQTPDANICAQPLRPDTNCIDRECGWHCRRHQDLASWVEVWRDMIQQNLLQELL